MKRENLVPMALLLLVLLAGWAIGIALQPSRTLEQMDAENFRTWFWQQRPLDLLVQVGMIFAGALGAAALLPHHRESSEISMHWETGPPAERDEPL